MSGGLDKMSNLFMNFLCKIFYIPKGEKKVSFAVLRKIM